MLICSNKIYFDETYFYPVEPFMTKFQGNSQSSLYLVISAKVSSSFDADPFIQTKTYSDPFEFFMNRHGFPLELIVFLTKNKTFAVL